MSVNSMIRFKKILKNSLILSVPVAFLWIQPIYSLIGANPAYVVHSGVTAGQLWLFALLFTIAPVFIFSLLLLFTTLIGKTIGAEERMVSLLINLLLLIFSGLFFFVFLQRSGLSVWPIALVLGFIFATVLIYTKAGEHFRTALFYISPALILFPVIFLFFTPVRQAATASPASFDLEAEGKLPIVLIILDELPTLSLVNDRGTIDRALFPNFGRLLDKGTWYKNATTVSRLTDEAVPAILTGQYPKGDSTGSTLAGHPANLFTYLSSIYEFHVQETVTRLCPAEVCNPEAEASPGRGLAGLFDDVRWMAVFATLPDEIVERSDTLLEMRQRMAWWTRLERTDADPTAEERLLQAENNEERTAIEHEARQEQEMEAIAEATDLPGGISAGIRDRTEALRNLAHSITANSNSLYFHHSLLPHIPYEYYVNGEKYPREFSVPGWNWRTDNRSDDLIPIRHSYRRHLIQLAYTDSLIGEILDQIEASGIEDEFLFILTADHGVNFLPGEPRRALSNANRSNITHVPFFVIYPGQDGGRVSEKAVTTADIVPLIAGELGLELPWRTDGAHPESEEVAMRNHEEGYGPLMTTAFTHLSPSAEVRNGLFDHLPEGASSNYSVSDLLPVSTPDSGSFSRAEDLGFELELRSSLPRTTDRTHDGRYPAMVRGQLKGVAESKEMAVIVRGQVEKTFFSTASGDFVVLIPGHVFEMSDSMIEIQVRQ